MHFYFALRVIRRYLLISRTWWNCTTADCYTLKMASSVVPTPAGDAVVAPPSNTVPSTVVPGANLIKWSTWEGEDGVAKTLADQYVLILSR